MPNKSKRAPQVLIAASECFPLLKTGGLADVVGALPLALKSQGVKATLLLPGYPKIINGLKRKKAVAELSQINGLLISGRTDQGIPVIVLDVPELFDVPGNPYLSAEGLDREDNAQRFGLFSKVAAELADGRILPDFKADILHAHDWQAGLACAYLKAMESSVPSIFTIHNLAFQGIFPETVMNELDLPDSFYEKNGLEYWGKVSFMKAGLVYADHITTVSPTYALEIQSDDAGMGMGGILKARQQDLSGILNGIDTDVWNPARDPDIPFTFSAESPGGKSKNKTALQKELGLRRAKSTPLFGVISRLTTQKGLDLLAELTDHIVQSGGQIALLGSGDAAIEMAFRAAMEKHPTEISVTIGYDEALAHRIQAGTDAIFIPSRFEPCGLTQLCAMRYGTVPIAARVGGLNDTIIDSSPAARARNTATGLLFSPVTLHNLAATIDRAIGLYKSPKAWASMRQNCLDHPVGWQASAKAYKALYSSIRDR